MPNSHLIHPVAIAHTPFDEKFAIPRQSNLIAMPAQIELIKPYNKAEAVEGLQQVSHLWLSFIFDQHLHDHGRETPRLSIRPPRLGGNKKMGVFASRSSFRPNAIGQSVVALQRVECSRSGVILHVTGIDLLDKTPIIDIKPYLPYADCINDARNQIAPERPAFTITVRWTDKARQQLMCVHADGHDILPLIEELIALDPRPAYKRDRAGLSFAMAVFALDIRWTMLSASEAEIVSVTQQCSESP